MQEEKKQASVSSVKSKRSKKDDKKKAWQAEEQKHLDRLAICDDRKSERSVSSAHSSQKPATPKRPSD